MLLKHVNRRGFVILNKPAVKYLPRCSHYLTLHVLFNFSRIFCRWCRVRRRDVEIVGSKSPDKISTDQVGKETYMPSDMVTFVVYFNKQMGASHVDTKLNLSDKCFEGILKYISWQRLTETQNEGVLCILGWEN